MSIQHGERWSAVLAERDRSEDLPSEPGPSLRLVHRGSVIPVDWLDRLNAVPGLDLIAMQMRSIGPHTEQIASHRARRDARELGDVLWLELVPTVDGPCAYWASLCGPSGLEALSRQMSGSTAARDTLVMLLPDTAQPNADGELARLFLRHMLGSSTNAERLEETKAYARDSGGVVAIQLRDADQNIGLALSDGTDEPPWRVVGQFRASLGSQIDGLHPNRFWPALPV